MKKFMDQATGYLVCGIFVLGAYCIAHYLLGASDRAVMLFLLAFVWGDMAGYVNKPENAVGGKP